MADRLRRWGLTAWATGVVGVLALNVVAPLPGMEAAWPWAIGLMAFPVAAALVLGRRPGNPIGRTLGVVGFAAGAIFILGWLAVTFPSFPASAPMETLSTAAAAVQFGGLLALLHLFPTGRPLGSAHRRVVAAVGCWTGVMIVAALLRPGPLPFTGRPNPLGVPAGWIDAVFSWGAAGLPVFTVLGIGALWTRHRRADSVERAQLNWFLVGAAAVLLMVLIVLLIPENLGGTLDTVAGGVIVGAFWSLPAAVVIAVLRYRLYDIDVVVNRALVYGALAAFITVVYVAIVVGVGAAVGGGDRPNLVLSVAATAVVAVAFQPVRERVQRWANRLVYGHRATPYEVLSAFSERMAEEVPVEQRLARMARLLAEGTAARRADVWLLVGEQLRPAASWPADDVPIAPLPLLDGELPDMGSVTASAPVRHDGELLGALTVTKPGTEALQPVEDRLLTDLAGHTGLVLRNVRLTAELLDRIDELRASRQRLVSAQDETRRQLERNLHDGAQQQLVALKMRLALAKRIAKEEQVRALLEQLAADTDDAIETLRDLARGIYPPLLAAEGLVAALTAQARKAAVPVRVEAAGMDERYGEDVEAAVYFCCLEALQNAAKYASATTATIRLEATTGGGLTFEVRDDGGGFDPQTTPMGSGLTNMTDRVEALGGTLSISAAPGAGTAVRGHLPARRGGDGSGTPRVGGFSQA